MKFFARLNKYLLKDKKKAMEYLLLVAAAGIALIVIAGMFESNSLTGKKTKEKEINSATMMQDRMDILKEDLEELLSTIKGAGKVRLMISYDSTTEQILARETSQSMTQQSEDKNSNVSRQFEDRVIMRDTDNGSEPAVVKEVLPQPKGILVVAKGADNMNVKRELIAAVKAVTGLAEYKIQVLPAD